MGQTWAMMVSLVIIIIFTYFVMDVMLRLLFAGTTDHSQNSKFKIESQYGSNANDTYDNTIHCFGHQEVVVVAST